MTETETLTPATTDVPRDGGLNRLLLTLTPQQGARVRRFFSVAEAKGYIVRWETGHTWTGSMAQLKYFLCETLAPGAGEVRITGGTLAAITEFFCGLIDFSKPMERPSSSGGIKAIRREVFNR